MPDAHYEHPRLVAIYDALDAGRVDLEAYVDMVAEFGARRVLDVGCGTGTFALLLAKRGVEVTGVDPAAGSLDVARRKPGGHRVRWIHGDATTLPPMQVDLATMTANVAQAIADASRWNATLRGVYQALRPGGRLVFESRDPGRREWEEWNRDASYRKAHVRGVGVVETWADVLDVEGPLVRFRQTWVFASDGATLTSESTLRFRTRQEVEDDLADTGYAVDDVRVALDGRELVFVAGRPEHLP